ncbi:CHAT domain-containing tetratricopeptide repeat protein [Roseofilum casamattae]|uniref:Tetratricopeptide repeat protein n=1 Tax=Roseofilum casamattae BLCC-M143 TaxID=3022442 RepID=A0ABT7BRZ2_9CYAN|nr:tetratricopeptide repeat protein [Roseofilum casamattae]MDJ1181963.1 tetratricopeptide repeat protein [Roseofilum casamattae BLCC-M143]
MSQDAAAVAFSATSGDRFWRSRQQQIFTTFSPERQLLGQAPDATNQADSAFAEGLELYQQGTLETFKQAIPQLETAYELYREQENQSQSALSALLLGIIYKNIGQLPTALDYGKEAVELYDATGDRIGSADSLNQVGLIYQIQGEMEPALEVYRQALVHYQDLEDVGGAAYTFNNIGVVYDRLGKYQEALDRYNRALPLWREVEDGYGEATTLNNIGVIYDHLGDYERSVDAYERALATYKELDNKLGMARTLNNIGLYYDAIELRQQALIYYERALPLWEEVGDIPGTATTLNNIGYAYAARRQFDRALPYYERALPLWEEVGDRKGKASTLNNLGYVYANRGESQQALDYYQQALQIREEIGDRPKAALSLYRIAQVQQTEGELETALETLQPAIAIIEDLRINVASQELRTSFFAAKQDYYELYIDLLMQLHRQFPEQGYDARALQVSEQARARSLLDILAEAQGDVSAGVAPGLLQQKQMLQQQLNLKEERRIDILSRPHTKQQADAIATEIKLLLDRYRGIQALIRASSPRYAALTQPQPLSLAQIQQQVLDSDTILLEYFLGAERSYLWAVSSTEITSYELPPREDVETLARQFRDSIIIPRQRIRRKISENLAMELSEQILAPVGDRLQNKRLAIVAHGALQYIPFAALSVPKTPEYTPLIASHELVHLPSASTVALLRRDTQQRTPAAKTLAILADPVFGQNDTRVISSEEDITPVLPPDLERSARESGVLFDRLPYTQQEAETILDLVPAEESLQGFGFKASRELATSAQLSDYQIVHFATHGLLNSTNPALSGLVFSLVNPDGNPLNGFLRLHEVFNLNLPAELIVLSACETGLGKEIRGEGLVGLTRGFMYAGAPRLAVSLWSVDDEATAQLAIAFYRNLLQQEMSPPEALRQAQLELLQNSQWRQPYYWASFTLQGEWNPLASASDRQ